MMLENRRNSKLYNIILMQTDKTPLVTKLLITVLLLLAVWFFYECYQSTVRYDDLSRLQLGIQK